MVSLNKNVINEEVLGLRTLPIKATDIDRKELVVYYLRDKLNELDPVLGIAITSIFILSTLVVIGGKVKVNLDSNSASGLDLNLDLSFEMELVKFYKRKNTFERQKAPLSAVLDRLYRVFDTRDTIVNTSISDYKAPLREYGDISKKELTFFIWCSPVQLAMIMMFSGKSLLYLMPVLLIQIVQNYKYCEMYIYLKKFSAFGSQNSQSTSKVTVAPIAGSFVNKDIHVRTDNVHKEDSNMKKSPSSDNFAREYSTSHTTSSKLALSSLPRNLSKKTLKKPLSGESQVFHKNYSKKNLGYRSIGADLNTYPRNGAVNVSMYFEHKKEKASTLNQALTNYYKIESIISKSSKKAEIRKDSVVDNSSRKIKRRNTQPDTRSVSSISGAASEISKVGFYGETLCEKLSLDFDKESAEDDCYWWEAVMR